MHRNFILGKIKDVTSALCHKEADTRDGSVSGSVWVFMEINCSIASLTWAINCHSEVLNVGLVAASTYCVNRPASYPATSKSVSPV